MLAKIALFIASMAMLGNALPLPAAQVDNIEIILDASYTMNEPLGNGKKKLDIAREAILDLLNRMDGECSVALRVYGHLALRILKDCTDSELLVPLAPVAQNKAVIERLSKSIYARGVTPLSNALGDAAADFFGRSYERNIIILIADGYESCEGDPCAVAASLPGLGRKMVVHTIGFRPDSLGGEQLRCIAAATGGRYVQAVDKLELGDALWRAVADNASQSYQAPGEGRLTIEGAGAYPVKIVDAVSGQKVSVDKEPGEGITLPAGIYTVQLGHLVWKSVWIAAGQETVLSPGRLHVTDAWQFGHRVAEWESKHVVGVITPAQSEIFVLPGDYEVMFGNAIWRVAVPAGTLKTVTPGVVTVANVPAKGIEIRVMPSNTVIGGLTRQQHWMPLPPGEYSINIKGQTFNFSLSEGQRRFFNR